MEDQMKATNYINATGNRKVFSASWPVRVFSILAFLAVSAAQGEGVMKNLSMDSRVLSRLIRRCSMLKSTCIAIVAKVAFVPFLFFFSLVTE